MAAVDPKRGEIWNVNFDPTRGDELSNLHPALVMNIRDAGRLKLRMVVPITTGNPGFTKHFWMVGVLAYTSKWTGSRFIRGYVSVQIRVS